MPNVGKCRAVTPKDKNVASGSLPTNILSGLVAFFEMRRLVARRIAVNVAKPPELLKPFA